MSSRVFRYQIRYHHLFLHMRTTSCQGSQIAIVTRLHTPVSCTLCLVHPLSLPQYEDHGQLESLPLRPIPIHIDQLVYTPKSMVLNQLISLLQQYQTLRQTVFVARKPSDTSLQTNNSIILLERFIIIELRYLDCSKIYNYITHLRNLIVAL